MKRHYRTLACYLILLLVATACSSSVKTASRETAQSARDGDAPSIDWEHPLVAAMDFDTVPQADARVAFQAVLPRFNVAPSRIQVAGQSDPSHAVLGFLFRLPEGRVFLIEQATTWTAPQVVAAATSYPPGSAEVVLINDTQALLLKGDNVGRLKWVRGGVLFDLYGERLTPEQAVQLAKNV